jgi:cation diffusion facilitator family transporter
VRGKKLTLYGAIAANLAIAITKFIAAAAAGSGAMLSEGIHSVVDTGDGLLLLLGLHLSKRPPSARHPYGHGLEVYFWSMVVAMAIFAVGGGVSIYEGVHRMAAGESIELSWWTYAVLGVAFLFEGTSWSIAMREFKRTRGRRGIWTAIERSKDPTTFIVVLEDSAALIGILIAAAGITSAHVFDAPFLDALASILIGLLLATVAVILGRETWSLLIGEAASPEVVESIQAIAEQQPHVVGVETPRTMHLGPDHVHVDLDVHVDSPGSADELLETSRQIEARVRERHPVVKRVSLRFT